jgi:hypothetical protein
MQIDLIVMTKENVMLYCCIELYINNFQEHFQESIIFKQGYIMKH